MNTTNEIETLLTRAMAAVPSERAVRVLDHRVARAIGASTAAPDRQRFRLSPLVRVLAVAAAFVILTSTVVGAMNLIERTVEPVPAWRTAWDRGEILGLQATDAGVTVTLERAYVDLNQVFVVLTATDLDGLASPRSSGGFVTDHLIVGSASLRDPAGREPVLIGGTDVVEPGLAASVRTFQFDPPTAGAGIYTLVISDIGFGGDGPDCESPCSSETVTGTWAYEFVLPAPVGVVVTGGASDTVGTARLDLTGMLITPTTITARIAMFVDDQPVAWWALRNSNDVRRGDDAFSLTTGRHILEDGAEVGPESEFSTMAGTDDAAGTWEIVISAVDYGMSNEGEPQHLSGPWTLAVTVP